MVRESAPAGPDTYDAIEQRWKAFLLADDAFATFRDDWTKRWAPVAGRARIAFAGSSATDS